jgi:hypothetical protein
MQDSICGTGDEDFNEHYQIGVDKLLASRGVTADSDDDAHGRALVTGSRRQNRSLTAVYFVIHWPGNHGGHFRVLE